MCALSSYSKNKQEENEKGNDFLCYAEHRLLRH